MDRLEQEPHLVRLLAVERRRRVRQRVGVPTPELPGDPLGVGADLGQGDRSVDAAELEQRAHAPQARGHSRLPVDARQLIERLPVLAGEHPEGTEGERRAGSVAGPLGMGPGLFGLEAPEVQLGEPLEELGARGAIDLRLEEGERLVERTRGDEPVEGEPPLVGRARSREERGHRGPRELGATGAPRDPRDVAQRHLPLAHARREGIGRGLLGAEGGEEASDGGVLHADGALGGGHRERARLRSTAGERQEEGLAGERRAAPLSDRSARHEALERGDPVARAEHPPGQILVAAPLGVRWTVGGERGRPMAGRATEPLVRRRRVLVPARSEGDDEPLQRFVGEALGATHPTPTAELDPRLDPAGVRMNEEQPHRAAGDAHARRPDAPRPVRHEGRLGHADGRQVGAHR